MQDSYRLYLIGGAVLIILAATGFWLYGGKTEAPMSTTDADITMGTTTTQLGAGPSPLLDRAIPATSPTLDAQARATAIVSLEKAIAQVRANSFAYGEWLKMGSLRQRLGDYEGAALVWRYMVAQGTLDAGTKAVAYGNLGNLYTLYLKDYSRAEANYKAAIGLNSSNADSYRSLHELYRYTLKDAGAAESILRQGIQNIPKALDLQVLLARYLKDLGRTTDAKAAYDVAISTATAAGNTAAQNDLRAERDAF